MLILDSNDYMIKSIKKMLTNKFDMKDLGVVDVIPGIKIIRTSNELVCPNLIMLRKFLRYFLKVIIASPKHQYMDISLHLYKKIKLRE
jgi:hypothetical protein